MAFCLDFGLPTQVWFLEGYLIPNKDGHFCKLYEENYNLDEIEVGIFGPYMRTLMDEYKTKGIVVKNNKTYFPCTFKVALAHNNIYIFDEHNLCYTFFPKSEGQIKVELMSHNKSAFYLDPVRCALASIQFMTTYDDNHPTKKNVMKNRLLVKLITHVPYEED